MIGANGIVRGKKVTSLARWPPNPSRCWALTWRTIGPMEDYWARSGGLLAEWPLSTSGGVFPLTRLTTSTACDMLEEDGRNGSLAVLLVLEPGPELERGSKAPRSRRGAN